VTKACQNPIFFSRLGLVSSEEHIPQVNENTEKAKWLLVALESAVTRPRQERLPAEQVISHCLNFMEIVSAKARPVPSV
jgi:hypothetical protein